MNELLMCIDQIDQSVNNAEINVLESLISSYDKALMILQESSVQDYSSFEIFQEGEKWDKFKEDSKAPILGNKGESFIKRLLMIIPRLIQKLIALIRELFTKNKSFEQKMDKDVDNLKKQAQTVVPEQLSEEQAKSIVEKLNETKVDVNDSLDTKREKINKMMNSMKNDETLKFNSDGSIALSKITPDVVKNIDKKNPGLIDDILKELGGKPRKKTKFEDVKIEIQHTTFFGTDMSNDNRMENSQAAVMKIHTDPLINGFDELKSNRYSDQAKREYAAVLKEIHEDWLDTVDYIINNRIIGKTIYVTFGEVVKVFEQMKQIFENDVKESKKSCDAINQLIKKINSEYDKFNSPESERVGVSQGELLMYLKDVITVLSNIVEMASRCLEGWEMIWNINWNAVQDVLKDDNFKNDTHPTFHMPFINSYTHPVYDGWENKIRNDLNRWKHTPMPVK